VGRGEMLSSDVVRAVYADFKDVASLAGTTAKGAGWVALGADPLKMKLPDASDDTSAIPIRGLNADLPVRFAPQSGAVPGDRIVGIITPGEGVTIYPIQSQALAAFENAPEAWVDVRWDVEAIATKRFPAKIRLETINEPGSLAQITQVVADHDGNIDNISMQRRTPDFTDILLDASVWDLKHLNGIIAELRAKRVISKVERVMG